MKRVLAVIPARAGSKGIPNKNIRIVNNKPLICYSIQNAIDSKMITDIIVTTDSSEIEIIAKQMKVPYKHRNETLCGDEVTLDAVIFDAIDSQSYDYIVTMQPTSPTLEVSTLDRAIAYCIERDLDTVISVINAPHLSWKEKDGKKVPNYTARLNRQYLPPCYLETGAFVVSKANIVTKNTRIGSAVDVFEIAEKEAVDIDTFEDLKNVETILASQKIAIYVNGNNKLGTGHIYRALEVADGFYTKPDIYYDTNQTNSSIFGQTTHNLIGVQGEEQLFQALKKEQYDIIINDVLSTTNEYMKTMKSTLPLGKIVNFEDDGEGTYKADLVINALYQHSELSHVKTGERFYIASKLFMFYHPIEIREQVKTVLITFGGADPKNYTDRVLEIVSKSKYDNIQFIVVLGRAKENIDQLMKYNEKNNIEVFYDVSNMPELMSRCDMAITSRGRTGYELAILGIPTIAMAQNSREEKHGFVSGENGFTYLGLNPSNHMIESNLDSYLNYGKTERQQYQDLLLSHDLKKGRKRVLNLINSL